MSFKKISKSVAAIAAGFILVIVLNTVTDHIVGVRSTFEATEQSYLTAQLILFLIIYRTLFSAVGGFLTSTLSPVKGTWLAIVMGCILVATNLPAFVVALIFSPIWYSLLFVFIQITTILGTYFGGKINKS